MLYPKGTRKLIIARMEHYMAAVKNPQIEIVLSVSKANLHCADQVLLG